MAAGDSTPEGPTANGRASLGGTPSMSAALAAIAPSASIPDAQISSGAADGGPLSLSLSHDAAATAAAAATIGSPFKRARASQAGADGSPVDVSAAKKASDIFGSIVGTASSTPMDADAPSPSPAGQQPRSPLAPAPPVGGSALRRSIGGGGGGGAAEDRNMEDEEL
jgi:hypothetical protein